VNCILEDRTGRVGFATHHAGVCYLEGGKVTAVTAADGVRGVEVWDLFLDRDGRVWFPVENDGVYRFDGRSYRNYTAADGLASNAIQCTHQDAAGRIWLGGYRGLFRVEGERVVAVTAAGPWR
jgi:ligand-binding sensor domain-containing protein